MSAVSGGGEDLIARLQRSLHDLGEHRLTHVVWRDWLLKDPANEQVNPHAGSAKFHDDTIKDYDRHLANIEEAIHRLASGGGGELATLVDDLRNGGLTEEPADEFLRGLRAGKRQAADMIEALASTGSAPAPSVDARVCGYAPGLAQVHLQLPSGPLPDWLELGYPVVVSAAPTQEPQP